MLKCKMPEKYVKNFRSTSVSGNSTYSGVIKQNDFNMKLRHSKAFFRSFSDANAKQLRHYIIPTLIDDKSDVIVIHVGTTDILNHTNYEI